MLKQKKQVAHSYSLTRIALRMSAKLCAATRLHRMSIRRQRRSGQVSGQVSRGSTERIPAERVRLSAYLGVSPCRARRALLLALVACFFLVVGLGRVEAEEQVYTIHSMSNCPGCARLAGALNLPVENGGIRPDVYDKGNGLKIEVVKDGLGQGERYPAIKDPSGKWQEESLASRYRPIQDKLAQELKQKVDAAKKGDEDEEEEHNTQQWCCEKAHPGPKNKICQECKSEEEDDESNSESKDDEGDETEENKHDKPCDEVDPEPDPEPDPGPEPAPPPPDGGGGGGGGGLESMLPALMQAMSGMKGGQQQQQPEQTAQPDDGSAIILAKAAQTAAAEATAAAQTTAAARTTAVLPTSVVVRTPATTQAVVGGGTLANFEGAMFPPLSTPVPTRIFP